MFTRRQFGLTALTGLFTSAAQLHAAAETNPGTSPDKTIPAHWTGEETVVFLGYQGMTALDLIGPQYVLAGLWGASVKIAAKSMEPLLTDTGIVMQPDLVFEEVPEEIDILCVPGGFQGTLDLMKDQEVLEFLAGRGRRAKHVTSICTGSLLLGQAGLLGGYEATSHWMTRPMLTEFGAVPVNQRVVRDRNRMTAAGVTSGIDMALTLVAELRDDTYAQGIQLLAEYAPEPPFNAGTPETAPAEVSGLLQAMYPNLDETIRTLAQHQIR